MCLVVECAIYINHFVNTVAANELKIGLWEKSGEANNMNGGEE